LQGKADVLERLVQLASTDLFDLKEAEDGEATEFERYVGGTGGY
jgi:hypothetical protein